MKTKLTIPEKINVGFQKRQDTYTGKLAYVVYTDAKGVLRKEKSWDGWRDKTIDAQEFENVPTDGFVLNKKVGDYGGWNPRRAWIRVYDPRDFEFEISVANLLFILQETSAIKGKGLEGEFVYAWDGQELVLLPVGSAEYQSSSQFTDLQTKKVSKSEMREGCLYQNKDNEQVMYLGRHDWYELVYNYHNGYSKELKHSKQHIFVSIDGKSTYWPQKGFTKLAVRLSEEPSPLFAEEYEKFKKSANGSKPTKLVGKAEKTEKITSGWDTGNYYYKQYCIKEKDEFFLISLYPDYYHQGNFRFQKSHSPVRLHQNKISLPSTHGTEKSLSKEELEKLPIYSLHIQNEEGSLLPI